MNPQRSSIWMGPWDVAGRDAGAVLDELQGCGIQAASLALAYHGGRMLLGNHPKRVVYEQHPSAVYFRADITRFGDTRPEVAPEARAAREFLRAAARRGFPVEAWTVLCHNDLLGARDASLCIRNVFGEAYSYALCPSNPRVQDYCVELCRQTARVEGIAGIDLEALSFLGYPHASAHDKRGATLPPAATELLSICLCAHCRAALGGVAGDIEQDARQKLRAVLAGEAAKPLAEELEAALILHRATTQRLLLERIREATQPARLNLRLAPDAAFTGGKCSLPAEAIAGLVEEATFTFFGVPLEHLRMQAARLKPQQLPLRGGFVFHGPDCKGAEDVIARREALSTPAIRGISFYCYSMAAPHQLNWLRSAIHGG